MWSEEQVRSAAENWRAVADGLAALPETPETDNWRLGLAEGYASALEMVLREER